MEEVRATRRGTRRRSDDDKVAKLRKPEVKTAVSRRPVKAKEEVTMDGMHQLV